MPIPESQRRAVVKYTREHYDSLTVLIPKGERENVKRAAVKTGKSMNAFVWEAISEKIVRDSSSGE